MDICFNPITKLIRFYSSFFLISLTSCSELHVGIGSQLQVLLFVVNISSHPKTFGARATFSWNGNKFFKLLQFHEKKLSVPRYFYFVMKHFFLKKSVSATKSNFKSIWIFFVAETNFLRKRNLYKKYIKNTCRHTCNMNWCKIILFN